MGDYERHPDLVAEIRKLKKRLDALERPKKNQTRYWEKTGEDSTTSSSYVSLGDEVRVTLANNGLIFIAYVATWKQSTSLTANCGLHFNDNFQRYVHATNGATFGVAAQLDDEVDKWAPLAAWAQGMTSLYTPSGPPSTAYVGDVTTGQALGLAHMNPSSELQRHFGPFVGWAAPGTYTIGPRFLASSGGTVTVKNRKLWVWTHEAPAVVT